jgi:AMMECR1 domain-containing protein
LSARARSRRKTGPEHPFPSFPWKDLRRPLRDAERADVVRAVGSMLRFQRTLARWAPISSAPDATPFVSLYANGRLCGCYGSDEGQPAEQLARAFLRAAHDGRFAPVSASERADLVAQVSYVKRPRLLNPENADDAIEVGTDGVSLVRDGHPAVIVLPHVAREERLGPRELLDALLRKARADAGAWRQGGLYAFETEDIVVRRGARAEPAFAESTEAAARWLASLVGADGAIAFAIDPRRRRRFAHGEMHHGRSAIVVQALAAHGKRPALVTRARTRLERDIRSALGGAVIEGWSPDPERVASTLALAIRAGVPLVRELVDFIEANKGPETPWYAAQVVAALGPLAPRELWESCIADLDRHSFAPWTLIAADARGDRERRVRAARGVAHALRVGPPHRGGASVSVVPETALTAIAVEALALHPAPWARAASARGREFLRRMQLVDGRIPGALDPELARGAFVASPIIDILRGDVTGHALLAMRPARLSPASSPAAGSGQGSQRFLE